MIMASRPKPASLEAINQLPGLGDIKRKEGFFMVTVSVQISDRDLSEIIRIGGTPWVSTKPEDKIKYERLISFYGSKLLASIVLDERR
jgi:hypothetical protein